MNILIEICYIGWESTIMKRGHFPVNSRIFRENADLAAAERALKWIGEMRRTHFVSEILKVTYDNKINITDMVKELDHKALENILF